MMPDTQPVDPQADAIRLEQSLARLAALQQVLRLASDRTIDAQERGEHLQKQMGD